LFKGLDATPEGEEADPAAAAGGTIGLPIVEFILEVVFIIKFAVGLSSVSNSSGLAGRSTGPMWGANNNAATAQGRVIPWTRGMIPFGSTSG